MGRQTTAGELTPSTGTQAIVAAPADEASIRRLLRENPMDGAIQLTFEREPNYFHGANLAGGKDQTILVSTSGQLVCVGRCTRRTCWVNGEPRSVAYLGELRMHHAAAGHGRYLRCGYEFFHTLEASNPADVYFTSIASDNLRARRVLESGMRGLPRYEFLAELTTVLVAIPRRASGTRMNVESGDIATIPKICHVLNEHAQNLQFAAHWSESIVYELSNQGLPPNRFRLVYDKTRLIASAGLWDQRHFRQTVVRRYSRALAFARPAINFFAALRRQPGLPKPGSTLAHAFLSPLACGREDIPAFDTLLESVIAEARLNGVHFVTLALPTSDPRLRHLQSRYRTRRWLSRLYQVVWPDLPRLLLDRSKPLLPEVSLL